MLKELFGQDFEGAPATITIVLGSMARHCHLSPGPPTLGTRLGTADKQVPAACMPTFGKAAALTRLACIGVQAGFGNQYAARPWANRMPKPSSTWPWPLGVDRYCFLIKSEADVLSLLAQVAQVQASKLTRVTRHNRVFSSFDGVALPPASGHQFNLKKSVKKQAVGADDGSDVELEVMPEFLKLRPPTPPPRPPQRRISPLPACPKKTSSRPQRACARKAARQASRCRLKHIARIRRADSSPIVAAYGLERASVAGSGWSGGKFNQVDSTCDEIDELRRERDPANAVDLTALDRTTHPIVDSGGRCFAALLGQPRDDRWSSDVTEAAATAMHNAAERLSFTPVNESSRRGEYRCLLYGVSFGGGRETPGVLDNTKRNARILADLVLMECFLRIMGFTKQMFMAFAPWIYDYYEQTLGTLFTRSPSLPRLIDSIHAVCTFNFGPRVVTLPHLDVANLAVGWCAVTALGSFDPDFGGHLVLWDIGLIIRFPPRSTIVIPSAILRHSNIAIREHETRYSFTQYTAAGLFRWVHNGFQSDKSFLSSANQRAKSKWFKDRADRWAKGSKMFSKVQDFEVVSSY
ncbi:hypothetical protein HGRIS_005404 [Hohenbuehelia grisea]|uniref:Uncharacterized protein n=1 Tax=Hohenbuehelia grisea TaxID=104357 RepID=A0ABR3JFD6_9AGAR